jgi:hypothetical protein
LFFRFGNPEIILAIDIKDCIPLNYTNIYRKAGVLVWPNSNYETGSMNPIKPVRRSLHLFTSLQITFIAGLSAALKKTLRYSFYLLFVTAAGILPLSAQTPVSQEYQLKAVFLFNFCQFVEWPPSAFTDDTQPLVIGVLGPNPFGSYLEETVSGEKINNHPVVVQYYSDIAEIKICHLLFIALSDSKKVEEAIASLKGKSILTISDKPDFLPREGMIKFFTSNNKIKFEINLEGTRAAGLALSSKLLKLAEIYEPSKNN